MNHIAQIDWLQYNILDW